MLIHYCLAKKYKIAASLFSAIQTLNSIISTTELIWLCNLKIDDLDRESTQAAVLASIAMLSYD